MVGDHLLVYIDMDGTACASPPVTASKTSLPERKRGEWWKEEARRLPRTPLFQRGENPPGFAILKADGSAPSEAAFNALVWQTSTPI
jgi:hypothetical protein